jgi:hypothetical protein
VADDTRSGGVIGHVTVITRSNVLIRAFIIACMVAVATAPRQAPAQTGSSQPPAATALPNPAGAARVKRVPISKSVYGDAGIIVNARDDGFIEIAGAGPQKTVLIQLRTMAARGWVDSTLRMLRARPRRSNTPRTYRAEIAEHGTSTTMALSRKITAGESEYSLFFSDDPLAGFTVPIEKSEADVFVAVVRRAVATAVKMLDKTDSTAVAKDSSAKDSVTKPARTKKPAAKRTSPPSAKAPSPGQPKATPPAPVKP